MTSRYSATSSQQQKFAESVLRTLREVPFGALPKGELDLALFRALIEAGILDPSAPTFELARTLKITPTRVRGLLYRYRLVMQDGEDNVTDEILAALAKTRFELNARSISFGIEDPYIRDSLAAELKTRGIFADSSFNPETVRLSLDAFVGFLESALSKEQRTAILRAISKDTHVELNKFAAVVKSALAQLGKRIVGDAAEDVAGIVVDGAVDVVSAATRFTVGLITGNAAAMPGLDSLGADIPAAAIRRQSDTHD
jgi:hypothetical protein